MPRGPTADVSKASQHLLRPANETGCQGVFCDILPRPDTTPEASANPPPNVLIDGCADLSTVNKHDIHISKTSGCAHPFIVAILFRMLLTSRNQEFTKQWYNRRVTTMQSMTLTFKDANASCEALSLLLFGQHGFLGPTSHVDNPIRHAGKTLIVGQAGQGHTSINRHPSIHQTN